MKPLSTIFLMIASLSAVASAELVEKTVEYKHGDITFEGFHVYDDAIKGARPAVLVIHQWTGLSDYEKRRSRMLAELGYNVFAADVYGKGVRPSAPKASGMESGKYKNDRALYRARLHLALNVLQKDPLTDRSKMAAVGYCFGGAGVLELAREEVPLQGVVSFHGSLSAAEGFEAKNGKKMPKILVLHGADDPYAPAEEVAGFQKEMTAAGADWQLILYSGAVHSFTQPHAGNDPSKGAAYDSKADERSWKAMKSFLEEIFDGHQLK